MGILDDWQDPIEDRTFSEAVSDYGTSLKQGTVSAASGLVSLVDMATPGDLRGWLHDTIGYSPEKMNQKYQLEKSPYQQDEELAANSGEGFVDTVKAYAKHPAAIGSGLAETAPYMLAGGALGRVALGLAPGMGVAAASGLGEGLITAGSQESQMYNEQGGETSLKQKGIALGSGAITGLVGGVSGRVASKLGFNDKDFFLTAGLPAMAKKLGGEPAKGVRSVAARIAGSGLSEAFQEATQTGQEAMFMNAALGKPIFEGVPEQIGQAVAVAGPTGGAVGILHAPAIEATVEFEEGVKKVEKTDELGFRKVKDVLEGEALKDSARQKIQEAANGNIQKPQDGSPPVGATSSPAETEFLNGNKQDFRVVSDVLPAQGKENIPDIPQQEGPVKADPGINPQGLEDTGTPQGIGPKLDEILKTEESQQAAPVEGAPVEASPVKEAPIKDVPVEGPQQEAQKGDGIITRPSGRPYIRLKSLQKAAAFRGIDNYVVAKKDGGFVGVIKEQAPKADPTKSLLKKPKRKLILSVSNKPFKTKRDLQKAAAFHGIDDYEVLSADGGFVGKRIKPSKMVGNIKKGGFENAGKRLKRDVKPQIQKAGPNDFKVRRETSTPVSADQGVVDKKQTPTLSRSLKDSSRANIKSELEEKVGKRGRKNLTESGFVNLISEKKATELLGDKLEKGRRLEGFSHGGKVYLVDGNIKKGNVNQIVLHETGHAYLPRAFKGRRWNSLASSFKKHKTRNTKTGKAVAEAYARMPENTPANKIDEEAMAYYITDKAAAGTPFHRRVLTYFKKALVHLGVPASILNPQDISAMVDGYLKKRSKSPVKVADNGGDEVSLSMSEDGVTEAGKRFMEVAGFGERSKTPLKTKAKEAKHLAGAKFRQRHFDQFDSFHRLLKDKTAWMMAHLTKSDTGALMTAIQVGTPYLEKSGAIAIKDKSKSLRDIFKPLGGESKRFLAWIAAHRAGKLMEEGRENLFSREDIEGGKQLDSGKMPDGKDRAEIYKKVRKEFEELGAAINKIGVETGLINKREALTWEKEGWYVPFYRMLEDTGSQGPSNINSLVNQKAYKKLKGGKSKLDDILSNTLLNWNHIISASLRNQAARKALDSAVKLESGIAVEINPALKGKNSVYVRENGQEKWYDIADTPEGKLVLESLLSLNYEGLNTRGMKVMRTFKRYLTTGVTASPGFKIRNLLRDTIHAAAVTTVSPWMIKNLFTGFKYDTKAMEAGGGAFSESGYIHGSDNEAKKRLVEQGVKDPGLIDSVSKIKWLWKKYEDVGAKLENVNRAAGFAEDLKAGKSLLEANFNARDQLDFSRTGTASSVRFISQVVPFFNARLQGLDKIYRSAGFTKEWRDKKQQKQFAIVAGTYAMASVLLYLGMKDDDDYKAAEDWEKRTYHLFKLPGIEGKMFRIPRPFEVGAIAYMAESMTRQFVDNNAKIEELGDELLYTLTSTFSFNPLPQIAKPMIEVYANKSMFTGRNIESMGMKYQSKTERFKPWTSDTAKAFSKLMDKGLPEGAVLSPVQIQHLVRGYTGWLGATVLAGIDGVVHMATNKVTPQKLWYEYQPVNSLVRDDDKYSKYVGKFYDNLAELSTMWGDIRKYRGTAKGQKLTSKYSKQVRYRKEYNRIQRKLSTYRKELERIYAADNLTAAQKRGQMKVVRLRMDALAKKIVDKTDIYF